jgi:hypothetical protein
VAGDGRFDGDGIARPDAFYLFADRLYGRGTFVAGQIRVLRNFGTDSASKVIMDVAAADANNSDLQEDVTVVFYGGLRQLNDFHLPDARQYSRLHYKFPGKTIVAAPLLRPAK